MFDCDLVNFLEFGLVRLVDLLAWDWWLLFGRRFSFACIGLLLGCVTCGFLFECVIPDLGGCWGVGWWCVSCSHVGMVVFALP